MSEDINTGHQTEAYEPTFVIKLMKFLVNLSWYLSIFASVMMVGIIIVMGMKDVYPSHLTIQVPMEITFTDNDENISVGDLPYPALVGFKGIMSFRAHEESPPLSIIVSTAVMVLLGSMMFALYQLRLLMQTVSIGNPFDEKNPLRMRIIGFITLFWGPVVSLTMYLNAHNLFTGNWLNSRGTSNVEFEIVWQGQNPLMLMGIVILVLAQIFAVGVELQHDKDLTI